MFWVAPPWASIPLAFLGVCWLFGPDSHRFQYGGAILAAAILAVFVAWYYEWAVLERTSRSVTLKLSRRGSSSESSGDAEVVTPARVVPATATVPEPSEDAKSTRRQVRVPGFFVFVGIVSWIGAGSILIKGGHTAKAIAGAITLGLLVCLLAWVVYRIRLIRRRRSVRVSASPPTDAPASTTAVAKPALVPTLVARTTETRLAELDRLRSSRVITEPEYHTRRAAIIEEI